MTSSANSKYPLYSPTFEHDSCGIGAVISIRGVQSHRTVDDALKIVEKLQPGRTPAVKPVTVSD